ncbi:hypothetical protein J6TS1_49750 [Siminovitchia terrae]|uniref:Uncharacterized protein n=1 Tax=Siminovitchia terrae TaxID=1914933 RepID=A0ABQ4L5D6_SIMTE|nr:hypothetical protein J6TS1_49750 [Siminovitchia terrae]
MKLNYKQLSAIAEKIVKLFFSFSAIQYSAKGRANKITGELFWLYFNFFIFDPCTQFCS